MTTTVTVRTRALGAVVSTNGQETQVAARSEHSFHVEEGSQTFEVRQNTQEEQAQADTAENLSSEEVPGREQNDELLGQGRSSRRQAAAPTGDNRSGAGAADTNV